MILGSVAKEGIYKGDISQLNLFSASGIFHMYMMGFAFRMAHTTAPRLKAKFAKWYGKNPMEIAIKLEVEQVKITKAKRTALRKIDTALEAAREFLKDYSAKESTSTERGLTKEAGLLRTEIAKLQKEIAKLERNRTKVKQAAGMELKAVISGFEAYVKEASQTKLIERPIRGFVETVLPGWLRTHFFKHYRKEFKMRDGTTKSLYLGGDGVTQMLLSKRPGDFRSALELIETSKRCILSPSRVIYVASRIKGSERRTEFLETAWDKMTSGHRYGYTRLVGRINPGRAKEHQIPKEFKVERKYKSANKQKAYRYARWRAVLLSMALGLGVLLFGACSSRGEQAKVKNDKIELSEKAAVTKGGGLYRSSAEHNKAEVATKKHPFHVAKAKVTKAEFKKGIRDVDIAGSKLIGYDGIDGTPKVKAWTKDVNSNIFHKNPAVRRAERRKMYKMLKNAKVPKHILYAVKNADQLGVPNNVQQFVFPYVVLDYVEGRATPIATPYILMYQHGFAKWWAKEYGKSVEDAPMLKDYLKYTKLIEQSKGEARLDTWWHSSFPGTFPIKPIVIFLMLFGAGRLTKMGLKRPEGEVSAPTPEGGVKNVRWWAHMLPRVFGLMKMQTKETDIILPREGIPSAKDIVGKKFDRLTPDGKRALDDIHERLLKSDFGMIRFPKDPLRTKETAEETSLRFFKDIVNGFYDVLRLQRIESMNKRDRTELQGEAAGLKSSVDAFELTLERKLLGRKSPFHWSQLLRPKGPEAVAKTLASILQLGAKPFNATQKRAVERLSTGALTKLAKLFKEFKGMRTVLLELIKLKKSLDSLEGQYNEYGGLRDLFFERLPDGTLRIKDQYIGEAGEPIGGYATRKGEANHAKAFCDVYEGMESQHSAHWKQWRTFAMKANNILGWLNKKARPNRFIRGTLNVLTTYAGYGILTWLMGDDFEKPEKGDVESGPGIPGLPIHPHEKKQDYEDSKRERIRKLLPQIPGSSTGTPSKSSGQSSGLPKEATNPPAFEGGTTEPKGSVQTKPDSSAKSMSMTDTEQTTKSIQDAIDHLTKQAERKKK